MFETELRFDRKLQQANIDQSKGDGKLLASRPRWQELSEQLQIQMYDDIRIQIDEDDDYVGRHTKVNAGFDGWASSTPRLAYKTNTSVGCADVDFPRACCVLHVACSPRGS